jgi:hypothetical protein
MAAENKIRLRVRVRRLEKRNAAYNELIRGLHKRMAFVEAQNAVLQRTIDAFSRQYGMPPQPIDIGIGLVGTGTLDAN